MEEEDKRSCVTSIKEPPRPPVTFPRSYDVYSTQLTKNRSYSKASKQSLLMSKMMSSMKVDPGSGMSRRNSNSHGVQVSHHSTLLLFTRLFIMPPIHLVYQYYATMMQSIVKAPHSSNLRDVIIFQQVLSVKFDQCILSLLIHVCVLIVWYSTQR